MVTGQCHCGAVAFEIDGPLSAPNLCHCGMCRRINGAPGAFTGAPAAAYRIRGEDGLSWYRSSADAERGFCRHCGTKLFWREVDGKDLDVCMGSLNETTGLKLGAHIWAPHQGDYYAIGNDGVPRYAQSSRGGQPVPPGPAPDAGPSRPEHSGRCECGAVSFTVKGRMRDVVVCHCGQCRRIHGHAPGYSAARKTEIAITGEDKFDWYKASPQAERGFCRSCGASLFWRPVDGPNVSVAAGALEPPTGMKTVRHIFAADKGDYYEIADGVPQNPGSMSDDPVRF